MGRKSKRKGYRGEKLFAELTGGKRIPTSGAAEDFPNDVILPNGWLAEVRWRANGFKMLYDWIFDEREQPDILALKADRKPFLVVMSVDKFNELLRRKEGDE